MSELHWEKLVSDCEFYTDRAKVPGGWLVTIIWNGGGE